MKEKGTTLTDLSGNGNNGTIFGASWIIIEPPQLEIYGMTNRINLIWNSIDDLPLGIDNNNVHLKITPMDADSGIAKTLAGIHIDYNTPPSITLEDIFAPQVANVEINYNIIDPENDVINLNCEFNIGDGWQPATVLGPVQNVTVFDSSITWFSMYDIGTQFLSSVLFKITPSDNDVGVMDETLPMLINNNQIPPGANVFISDNEQSDSISVQLILIDPNLEPEQLSKEYSVDEGGIL